MPHWVSCSDPGLTFRRIRVPFLGTDADTFFSARWPVEATGVCGRSCPGPAPPFPTRETTDPRADRKRSRGRDPVIDRARPDRGRSRSGASSARYGHARRTSLGSWTPQVTLLLTSDIRRTSGTIVTDVTLVYGSQRRFPSQPRARVSAVRNDCERSLHVRG